MVMYFINYVPKITFYYAKTKIFVRINKLKERIILDMSKLDRP